MSERRGLLHKELSEKIIKGFYEVYDDLGYGYLESAYQNALPIALADLGLRCKREVVVPVSFRGRIVCDFRADLIIENTIIIETKAATRIHLMHELQLLNYLKATKLPVGLLLNFGPKPEFQRFVYGDHPRPNKKPSV